MNMNCWSTPPRGLEHQRPAADRHRARKVGVLSFVLPNRRTEDIGRLLDQEGIAVRAGHHCSQPSLRRFGVETTVRPSLSFYNTIGEIDRLVEAVRRVRRLP